MPLKSIPVRPIKWTGNRPEKSDGLWSGTGEFSSPTQLAATYLHSQTIPRKSRGANSKGAQERHPVAGGRYGQKDIDKVSISAFFDK